MPETDKRGGRKLTPAEINMLLQIFATGVTLELVRVHKEPNPNLTPEQLKKAKNRTHTIRNDIYLMGDDWSEDVCKNGSLKLQSVFVHEMTHVWQHQNGVGTGGIEKLDKYHEAQVDAFGCAIDSLRHIIEDGVRYFQKKYSGISRTAARDSITAAIPETISEYNQSVHGFEHHSARYKEDKRRYRDRDEWDPVFQIGPSQEYESAWTLPWGNQVLSGLDLQQRPNVGERLSDFIWRSSIVRERYGTKATLLYLMEKSATDDTSEHATSSTDYNYRMQAPGKAHFLMLRSEAQAMLVQDYFILSRGNDPRTLASGNDFRPRPKLDFYRMMIPFLPGKLATCE